MVEERSTATVNVGSPEDPGVATKEHEVAVSELFHWVYRFFCSKTVGLILILVMAFYAVIGSVIAQTTTQTLSDPSAKQQFITQMREIYGGRTPILDALG